MSRMLNRRNLLATIGLGSIAATPCFGAGPEEKLFDFVKIKERVKQYLDGRHSIMVYYLFAPDKEGFIFISILSDIPWTIHKDINITDCVKDVKISELIKLVSNLQQELNLELRKVSHGKNQS